MRMLLVFLELEVAQSDMSPQHIIAWRTSVIEHESTKGIDMNHKKRMRI